MKAKAEREIFVVHKLEICVSPEDGVEASDTKYGAYRTDSNFIRIPYKDSRAADYSHAKGYAQLFLRLPVSELMVVREPSYHDDAPELVHRQIWCLEKDLKKALVMLDAAVDKKIKEMLEQMIAVNKAWENRNK
jgi:hypothetical protein